MLVRAVGIEPTLCHQNRILSPARLPVPPRPQVPPYSEAKFICQDAAGVSRRTTTSNKLKLLN